MEKGSSEAQEKSKILPPPSVANTWISLLDVVVRIVAVLGTLVSAVAMATTDETLVSITQFTIFTAKYNDLPSLSLVVLIHHNFIS